MTSFAGPLLSVDFHRHILDKKPLRENLIMQERMSIDDEIRGGNSSALSLSVNTVLYLLP